MKLSKRSDEFVKNVRLYLMTSGKNEAEIEEVAGELEDHLAELERRGKNVDSITGGSPAAYMKSLEREMSNDYASWLKFIPILSILVIAYSVMGSALNNRFELDIIQLIGSPIVVILSLIVYWVLFRNVAKKELNGKKNIVPVFVAVIVVNSLFIAVALISAFLVEPLYIASIGMNKFFVAVCLLVFIGGAVFLKSWIVIIIPILLFGPEFVLNFTSLSEEWKLGGGSLISMILILVFIGLHALKLKKKEAANG